MLKEIKTDTRHYFVDDQNRKQGEYKSYYDDGQLWGHAFYLNDKRHGEYKYYRSNGQLFEQSFYINGKHHGEYKSYHINGELEIHCFYQNSCLHGEYNSYYYNGKTNFATFFYQGKDLNVDLNSLTEKDKAYIMLSGRLPPKEPSC